MRHTHLALVVAVAVISGFRPDRPGPDARTDTRGRDRAESGGRTRSEACTGGAGRTDSGRAARHRHAQRRAGSVRSGRRHRRGPDAVHRGRRPWRGPPRGGRVPQRHHGARAEAAASRVPDAPPFRSHRRVPRPHPDACGARARCAARGVRPEGHPRDDLPHSRGLGRRHRYPHARSRAVQARRLRGARGGRGSRCHLRRRARVGVRVSGAPRRVEACVRLPVRDAGSHDRDFWRHRARQTRSSPRATAATSSCTRSTRPQGSPRARRSGSAITARTTRRRRSSRRWQSGRGPNCSC